MQFQHLEEQGVGISIPLQRFLDETESYAASVRGPDDPPEADWRERTASTETRSVTGISNPFAGSDSGDTSRSALTTSGTTVHIDRDASCHISAKLAELVYVVPGLQADADRCRKRRHTLDTIVKNYLDAELQAAVSDNSRQSFAVIE